MLAVSFPWFFELAVEKRNFKAYASGYYFAGFQPEVALSN